MGQRKASYRHTAYDDAFRTIEQECDDALIHFVNQMFGEKYKLDAKIDRLRNEHYTRDMGGKTRRRVTDSHFRIEYRGISKNYHLECESQGYSDEILFRMFEYDVSQSTAEGHENKLIVRIPISGLLVLSHTQNAPDHMIYDIETPGGKLEYRVPVVRMWDYSLNDIFDKQLYFLIPFYFFNEKNRFLEYNRDKKALKKFERTYTEIIRRLWKVRNTKLSDRSKRVIIRQMESVVN
ncbi:MAG: hypothetical protein K6A69_01600, partial [Lachnospiraceae bacterium]|nr:hypothetical protein [Lachnospiraceae bacterium]